MMKSCPKLLVGHYRAAMRISMTEAELGANSGDSPELGSHFVVHQDVLPQTAHGWMVAQNPVVGSFLFLQPWSVDQFSHHGSRLV